LTIEEQGRKIAVANPFYKITFFDGRGDYTGVEFTGFSNKLQFYCTSSMLYETKRMYFPNAQSKKEIEQSPDGREIRLLFSENITSESYNVVCRIKYTFYNDRPVFKYEAEIVQDPIVQWGGSLNTWNFGKEICEKLMPYYRTGPLPAKNGVLLEQGGNSIMAGDWKREYKYFAICDKINAVGMITPSRDDAFIYVYEKGNGYITGSGIKMDGKVFRTAHYVYLGPEEGLAGWANKLYLH